MRIGLFQACDINRNTQQLIAPLSLGYISSYLKKFGNYQDIFVERDLNKLISKKPDIVGITGYTENFTEICQISKIIKENLNIPIILGGHHITAIPKTLPNTIDIGVIGEGEETFFQLIQNLSSKYCDEIDFSKIDGIVYKENNEIHITKKRKELDNIDNLPIPDRILLNTLYYNLDPSLHTSRGCFYKCSFCHVFSKKVKFHSPQRVLDEIQEIKKIYPNKKVIHITDDIFAVKTERLYKIVSLIKEAKFDKEFIFTCHARANLFDRELCLLLKDMNVKYISFGFESGSNDVLKDVKAKLNIKDSQRVLDICNEMNVNVCGYFMAGFPNETKEDIAKTYWFLSNNKEKFYKISLTQITPFPDTELWDIASKKNIVDGINTEWDNLNFGYKHANSKIFFNDNYSFEFFENSFDKLMDLQKDIDYICNPISKNNCFLGKKNILGKDGDYFYNENIYNIAFNLIPSNVKNILEITNNNIGLENKLSKDINFLSTTYKNFYEITNTKFDFILINHILEQVREPKNFLLDIKNLLNENGLVLLLVYNINFIENIADIIQNYWGVSEYGAGKKKNFNYFSIDNLDRLFKKTNLEIIDIIEFTLLSQKYNYQELISLLGKYFNFDMKKTEAYSYLILLKKAQL